VRRLWLVAVMVVAELACAPAAPSKDRMKESTLKGMDTSSRVRLAQSYYENGRPAEALSLTRETVELDPRNAGLRNFYGQLLFLTEDLPAAERELKEALAIDPSLTDAHNNLGAVYDRDGRKTEAEAEFRTVLADRTYPTPEKAHLNLGVLYDGQGRSQDAIAELRRAVEVNPRFYQGHYELAGMLERAGKLQEAAQLYEVAAPAYRNFAPYHYRLGLTYFKLDDRMRAREHLDRVIELSPGSESAAKASEILELLR